MAAPVRRLPIWLLCFAVLGFVGYLDYLTGYEVSLSLFYLIPIALAAWFLNPWAGVFFAALCTTLWISVQLDTGLHFSRQWLPLWNSLMRFSFSAVTALLISKIRYTLREQAALVSELTATSVDGWEIGRLLPVCGGCKNVRTDAAYLDEVKAYIEAHPNARFVSHDCPVCAKRKIESAHGGTAPPSA